MRASLRVLGIESTCDETAAAVVEADSMGRGKILSNAVLSQIAEHAAYGGVVPEIAARAHLDSLDRLIRRALAEADCGDRRSRRHRRHRRARPDRRRHGRRDHRQGHRAGRRQALRRRQSSRSPCADAAPDRRYRLSLSAAAGVGRPLPARRGQRRRRLPAPRLDDRRRRRRSLRQGGQTARPALSRRPARRTGRARRRSGALRLSPPDDRAGATPIFPFPA